MKCLIASVENTGTTYVAGLVSQLTGQRCAWASPVKMEVLTSQEPVAGLVQHIYPKGRFGHADAILELFWRGDLPVIVPMRHPVKALISNVCRGKAALSLAGHVDSFRRVATSWLSTDTHIFSTDSEVPSLEAHMLAAHLGFPTIAFDLTPKNVTERTPLYNELTAMFDAGEWDVLNERLDGQITRLCEFWDFFSGWYDEPDLSTVGHRSV